jgi:large subunit ribosomal protein L23
MTLLKPIVTEQSLKLAADGRFSFAVEKDARRPEIRSAVEKIFKVKVKKIEVGKIPSKTYRSGKTRLERRRSSGKKAVVTLEAGQKIDLFEGVGDAS